MVNRTRPTEHETTTNGLAHDMSLSENISKATAMVPRNTAVQGYLLMAGGLAITLFAFGLFPIIKWAVVAAGAGLFLWGVVRSHVVERVSTMISNYSNKRS